MTSGLFHGWRVVATCFVISAVACSLCLFGASVYLQALTSLHHWPIAEVSSAITVYYLVSASSQRLVGRGIDQWGPRPMLTIGTLAMALGVALTGRVSQPWQLYPCFALIGIGWACLSATGVSATVAPWFERHQGRSITLALMGSSLGAIIGVPLLLKAIDARGVADGLGLVALLAALMLLPLIGWVLRFRGPAQLGLQRDGDASQASFSQPATAPSVPAANPGNRKRLLWSIAAGFALALMTQVGFITHHVTLAAPLVGATGAGLLVAAGGIAAFAGRLMLARRVDQLDVRRLAARILLAQAGALVLMAAWPGVTALIIGSLVYGYGIGHITTLSPIIVRREFGPASFGKIYGSVATVTQFSSAAGPLALGALRDSFDSYRPGLVVAATTTMLACLIVWAGRPATKTVQTLPESG